MRKIRDAISGSVQSTSAKKRPPTAVPLVQTRGPESKRRPGLPFSKKQTQGSESKRRPGLPFSKKQTQGSESKRRPGLPFSKEQTQGSESKRRPGLPFSKEQTRGSESKRRQATEDYKKSAQLLRSQNIIDTVAKQYLTDPSQLFSTPSDPNGRPSNQSFEDREALRQRLAGNAVEQQKTGPATDEEKKAWDARVEEVRKQVKERRVKPKEVGWTWDNVVSRGITDFIYNNDLSHESEVNKWMQEHAAENPYWRNTTNGRKTVDLGGGIYGWEDDTSVDDFYKQRERSNAARAAALQAQAQDFDKQTRQKKLEADTEAEWQKNSIAKDGYEVKHLTWDDVDKLQDITLGVAQNNTIFDDALERDRRLIKQLDEDKSGKLEKEEWLPYWEKKGGTEKSYYDLGLQTFSPSDDNKWVGWQGNYEKRLSQDFAPATLTALAELQLKDNSGTVKQYREGRALMSEEDFWKLDKDLNASFQKNTSATGQDVLNQLRAERDSIRMQQATAGMARQSLNRNLQQGNIPVDGQQYFSVNANYAGSDDWKKHLDELMNVSAQENLLWAELQAQGSTQYAGANTVRSTFMAFDNADYNDRMTTYGTVLNQMAIGGNTGKPLDAATLKSYLSDKEGMTAVLQSAGFSGDALWDEWNNFLSLQDLDAVSAAVQPQAAGTSSGTVGQNKES